MRIRAAIDAAGAQSRAALVPYFCAGDPNLDTTRDAVLAAVDAGADVVELGVPFSDPMADGPAIQAASQRALAAGSSLPAVLDLVSWLRTRTEVPVVLFGYYNPFFRYGHQRLATDAAAVGVDGLLVVDLPPEEAGEMVKAARARKLDRIFLLAPTSDEARMGAVAKVASGFVYFVSVTGVTGERSSAPAGIAKTVEAVRGNTGLPVGVGFGISNPEQAAEVGGYADLVIVGSAVVRAIDEAGPSGAARAVGELVGSMRRALDGSSGL